jgi:hypothetical protein
MRPPNKAQLRSVKLQLRAPPPEQTDVLCKRSQSEAIAQTKKPPGFPPHNPSVDIQAELEAFRQSALHRLKARLEGKRQRNYTVDERRDW